MYNKSVFAQEDFMNDSMIIANHIKGPWHVVICS